MFSVQMKVDRGMLSRFSETITFHNEETLEQFESCIYIYICIILNQIHPSHTVCTGLAYLCLNRVKEERPSAVCIRMHKRQCDLHKRPPSHLFGLDIVCNNPYQGKSKYAF